MIGNIEVLTQSSIRIQTGGTVIRLDPFQVKGSPKDAGLILITHDHHDHFSPEDIRRTAGPGAILVVPEKMKDKARRTEGLVGQIVTVRPGQAKTIAGIEIETVPAYNTIKPFHPKSAGWVGYILTLEGKRIYIAGDTDATREARQVRCDIALVPIGGTYTMDAKKAAELINAIHPEIAVPTHFGNIVGNPEDAMTFAKIVDADIQVVNKLRF